MVLKAKHIYFTYISWLSFVGGKASICSNLKQFVFETVNYRGKKLQFLIQLCNPARQSDLFTKKSFQG